MNTGNGLPKEERPRRIIAVKFCGGCNPTFDRLLYWEQIKAKTMEAVQWVGPDHLDPDGFLLISGCRTACPLKFFNPDHYPIFILIADEENFPADIAETLMEGR